MSISKQAAKLFIGLGNPGSKYADNRHNFGFHAIDEIARELKAPAFSDKFGGELSRVGELYLFKPMGFMNNSGIAAGQIASFYKIAIENTYVFYDELDVMLGKIKIKQGGGDGGHNGIKSLDAHMGKDYWRIRLGINHPGNKDMVHSHVLSDFYKEEEPLADKVTTVLAKNIKYLVQGDHNLFLTRFSGVMEPPKPRVPKPEVEKPKPSES